MNAVIGTDGTVRRRPGISSLDGVTTDSLANGVTGLFKTTEGMLLAVEDNPNARRIYEVLSDRFDLLAATDNPAYGEMLNGTGRPVFAETTAIVALAGGADVQKVIKSTKLPSRLGGSPPQASHVVANAARLLVNDLGEFNGRVNFSGEASGSSYTGHEQWNGDGNSGYVTAEGRPDPVVSLGQSSNDILAFGTSTVQIFTPDTSVDYAPVLTREFGISAPYSLIRTEGAFGWLDSHKRFVISDGRELQIISDPPIQHDLDSLTTWDDCFGWRYREGDIECLAWTFPTDGRTFVFQSGKGWGQWSASTAQNNWGLLPIQSHVLDVSTNVVGLSSGRVARLTRSATDDLGTAITMSVTSGFQNHKTDAVKSCNCLYIALRRGQTSSATGETAFLLWRDRPGPWEARAPIDLGGSGDTEVVVPVYSLGTYRTREWGFEYSGATDLALVRVTEDFTVEG
jgi:hypothetical protein